MTAARHLAETVGDLNWVLGRVDQARAVARDRLRCECFDPDSLDFAPAGPCARCELDDLLTRGFVR